MIVLFMLYVSWLAYFHHVRSVALVAYRLPMPSQFSSSGDTAH